MRVIARVFVLIVIILLVIAACNFPSEGGPAGTATAMVQTIIVQMTQTAGGVVPPAATTAAPPPPTGISASPTSVIPPTIVPTLKPPATSTPMPCNKAGFVDDVTYKDGSLVDPNASFVKTWRLVNTGTCSWSSGYVLVFVSGDRMSAPDTVPLTSGSVPPNGTVDVSVTLKAPPSAGTYQGYFKLRAPDGIVFGVGVKGDSNFWVKVVVGTTPTFTPTVVGTTPTFTPTFTPSSLSTVSPIADLAIQSFVVNPAGPAVGITVDVTFTIINQGTAAAGPFKVHWYPDAVAASPSCAWPIPSLAPGATVSQPSPCTYPYGVSGTYNSKLIVDALNEVPESNETNNTQTIPITVP